MELALKVILILIILLLIVLIINDKVNRNSKFGKWWDENVMSKNDNKY